MAKGSDTKKQYKIRDYSSSPARIYPRRSEGQGGTPAEGIPQNPQGTAGASLAGQDSGLSLGTGNESDFGLEEGQGPSSDGDGLTPYFADGAGLEGVYADQLMDIVIGDRALDRGIALNLVDPSEPSGPGAAADQSLLDTEFEVDPSTESTINMSAYERVYQSSLVVVQDTGKDGAGQFLNKSTKQLGLREPEIPDEEPISANALRPSRPSGTGY
jgi:hypothetical protein